MQFYTIKVLPIIFLFVFENLQVLFIGLYYSLLVLGTCESMIIGV